MNIRMIAATAALYTASAACTVPVSGPAVRSGVAVSERCPDKAGAIPPDATGAPSAVARGLATEIDLFVSAAGQNALWCGDATAEGYRVLWIPAYRPARLATLIKTSEGWRTEGVEYANRRGTELPPAPLPPQQISSRNAGTPSQASVLAFLAEIEAVRYWTVPAWRESNTTMDGAMWMIEGRRGRTYRVVSRSNFPDPALNHLVYDLFQIANIAPPEGVLRPHLP